MKKEFVLKLKAKHFKNTGYQHGGINGEGCAIEKALSEEFGIRLGSIHTSVEWSRVEEGKRSKYFKHTRYGIGAFLRDKKEASKSRYNKIIRAIKFTESL